MEKRNIYSTLCGTFILIGAIYQDIIGFQINDAGLVLENLIQGFILIAFASFILVGKRNIGLVITSGILLLYNVYKAFGIIETVKFAIDTPTERVISLSTWVILADILAVIAGFALFLLMLITVLPQLSKYESSGYKLRYLPLITFLVYQTTFYYIFYEVSNPGGAVANTTIVFVVSTALALYFLGRWIKTTSKREFTNLNYNEKFDVSLLSERDRPPVKLGTADFLIQEKRRLDSGEITEEEFLASRNQIFN